MTDQRTTTVSTPKWQWAVALVLLCFAIVLAATIWHVDSNQSGTGFVSAEVHFTDASHGLSIVPASCPSSPDYPGQCDSTVTNPPTGGGTGGTTPNGCPAGDFSQNGSCVGQCSSGYVQQGDLCVSASCPLGYALEGSQCVFVSCPSGYSDVNGSCVANQCSVGYSCVGNNLYYEDSSCTDSLVQACAYGCSVDACAPAPAPTASISAAPTIVKKGETSVITWSAQNVVLGSCGVTGNNGDSWDGATGSDTSSAIEGEVVYTLSCTGLNDSNISEQVTVNVVPSFQEQ